MPAGTERPESAFVRQALRGTRLADVQWIAETGSTNADLVEAARAGAGERVLITDLQTAGKGRRDRVWDAPARSSILMSVLLRDRAPADGFWAVGAIALAASQTIDRLIETPCALKWPNDVMIGTPGSDKKVAGVLAQLVDDAVIVGIGINVNWPDHVPAVMDTGGTAVNRHVRGRPPIDRASLAARILQRAIGHLGVERDVLRQAWKSQCSTLGRTVRLVLGDDEIVGDAVDIAADGALVLERDGVRSVHQVGDVVHLRPTS